MQIVECMNCALKKLSTFLAKNLCLHCRLLLFKHQQNCLRLFSKPNLVSSITSVHHGKPRRYFNTSIIDFMLHNTCCHCDFFREKNKIYLEKISKFAPLFLDNLLNCDLILYSYGFHSMESICNVSGKE